MRKHACITIQGLSTKSTWISTDHCLSNLQRTSTAAIIRPSRTQRCKLIHSVTQNLFQARHLATGSPRSSSRQAQLLDQHARDVERIASTIADFHAHKTPYRIAHGSTNSTRPRHASAVVDISKLNRVLALNREKRTVMVEPNVPMDRLVEATLPYGLVPPVVMEFPGITAGGGFAGTCGESSSFKHGFFNQTLASVEMVLANGDIVRASPHENVDLFYGAAGALGTLGVVTAVEINLEPAKKFVEVSYHRTEGFEQAVELSQSFATRQDIDYLDGILFSKAHGAIITGRAVDSNTSALPIQRFSAPSDPWYYQHVSRRTSSSSSSPIRELIPLAQYLFRYDRGGFWVGRAAFTYFHFPFNALTRWWLDDFLHTRMMYTALHASGHGDKYVVQDFGLPFDSAAGFLADTDRDLGIYPIWLCPLKMDTAKGVRAGGFHPHARGVQRGQQPGHILNVGLYGWPPKSDKSFAVVNRELNDVLAARRGTKWLYAQTYYTPEELWTIYDRASYEGLREKYGATGLPSVADKVAWKGEVEQGERKKEVWPMAGIRGLREAIASRTYVDARKSCWKYW